MTFTAVHGCSVVRCSMDEIEDALKNFAQLAYGVVAGTVYVCRKYLCEEKVDGTPKNSSVRNLEPAVHSVLYAKIAKNVNLSNQLFRAPAALTHSTPFSN